MKIQKVKGYQAILYSEGKFDVTPIANPSQLKQLISACENARNKGAITQYVIRHVSATYEIYTDLELGVI